MTNEFKVGKYKHYKGFDYQVLHVATHTETGEELVVYQSLYGGMEIWVRPLDMFTETVTVDGAEQPRFKYIDSIKLIIEDSITDMATGETTHWCSLDHPDTIHPSEEGKAKMLEEMRKHFREGKYVL